MPVALLSATTNMFNMNLWAVLVAALSSFVLGGLWYSPALFGRVWCTEMERSMDEKAGHPAQVFGVSFALAIISAFAFALWIGPMPLLQDALLSGALVGGGFVACCFGINYQFAGHSWKLLGIDAGYHFIQFLLFGLVLGLWH